jgi:nitrate reductase NapA
MSDLTRRDFVRSSALAAAAALAAQQHSDAVQVVPPPRTELPVIADAQWHKAPCRFCGTGCHVQVAVKEKRVVAVAGDRLADVNKGMLCVKGYHVPGILYGKDRLTTPMLRDKSGKLQPISWDEAIETIAQRILKSGNRFAIYGSGQWTVPEGYAVNKFMKGGLSNNNVEPNARLCMASAVTGYISSFGVDEPYNCYDDLDHADVVILWGNNPAEMHPVLFSRIIDRRMRNDKVVLIDICTRRTRTSEQSNHVFMMQPHGDLAIANCIAHQLVENGTYDKDFVGKYCNFRGDAEPRTLLGKAISFEEYRKHLPRQAVRGSLQEDPQPVVHGDESAHTGHGDQQPRSLHPSLERTLRQARRWAAEPYRTTLRVWDGARDRDALSRAAG